LARLLVWRQLGLHELPEVKMKVGMYFVVFGVMFFVFVMFLESRSPPNRPKMSKYPMILSVIAAVLGLAGFITLWVYNREFTIDTGTPAHDVPAPPLEPPPAVQKADAPLALARGIKRGT
jgi:hypothetical protein